MISLLKVSNIMREDVGRKSMNDCSPGKLSSSGNLFSLTYRPVPISVVISLYFSLPCNPQELPNERRTPNSSVCGKKSLGRTHEARGQTAGHTWRYVLKMCLADRVINSLIPIFCPKEQRTD